MTAVARPWWTSAGVSSAMPAWRWSKLYQRKKRWQWARASSMDPKVRGKSGRYLRVLNWLSLNGLGDPAVAWSLERLTLLAANDRLHGS